MDMRWSIFIGLLLLGVAAANEEEDDVPDAGVEEDDDEEQGLNLEESRNLRPRAYNQGGFPNTLPSGFRPTPSLAELAGYQQRAQQQEQQQQQQQQEFLIPSRPQQVYIEEQRPVPVRAPHRKQEQQRPIKHQQQQESEEELEEKEEPDRLSTLLQQSKFNCVSKNTGYYADEELNCEVFHYCQDNIKHSWICPEGFTFHQVHLICMPPTHDSICQKSSKYHFVNDYLYKPINEEEVQRKPNLSLKYSDRYFPSEVYRDDRYEQEEDEEEEEAPRRAPAVQQQRPTQRPQYQPQVFRSAEEVNIPLAQRRPQRPFDFDI
ncbi:probable basic-leucine zipper transcription factor Q [Maniola hyperantus]|uniref:probable basic-leucine zipper transcription factor Q n=1 Tax=Aphantopus hyperantus TaxID=2795564 RepID=UPI001569555A|nr:putative cyclin-dependent serine/threonine-protein kinase DDB_G0272797/DDB_G0274007 [Maniola hyperantus]